MSDEVINSPEIQQAAKEAFLLCLSVGIGDTAQEIRNKLGLSDEVINSPEVQQVAKKTVVRLLKLSSYSEYKHVLSIKKLGLSAFDSTEVQGEARTYIANLLSRGKTSAFSYMDELGLSKDLFKSSEFQKSAKEGIANMVFEGKLDDAFEIKDKIGLSDKVFNSPEIQQAAQERLGGYLFDKKINNALDFIKKLNLSDELVQQAAKRAIRSFLGSNHRSGLEYIYEIRDKFGLSIFKSVEVQQNLKEILYSHLSQGRIDRALKVKADFDLSINKNDMFEKFPDLEELVDNINKIYNGFAEQVEKSQDLLFSLFAFRQNPEELLKNIEQRPFLVDAISGNPQMGWRLLTKFPEFDEVAKGDIDAIFQIKKSGGITGLANKGFERLSDENLSALNKIKLPKQSIDIDPESVEFRILAQEQLMGFRNNRSIYETGITNGVNMEQWLSYDKEVDFELGEKEPVSFTEMVKTPILRMQETLENYQAKFKSILGQFRGELTGFKISSEDIEELKKQMLEKSAEFSKAEEISRDESVKLSNKERTDLEKKVKGIPKAIAGLQARIKNPKMVTLWDKIIGTYESVVALQKDLFKINDKISKAEKEELEIGGNKELPARERRSALQKVKAGKEKMQQEFKDKLENMNARLENFRTTLPVLVGSCLGEERTTALLQEIQEQTGENFNHYETDKSTLENILKDDDKKEKLDGRSMSLGVWNRNPDIDLYLGNYTACCICIDSEYHGAESPIADYITDIGMQVIKITDQKTGRPVVAAWCYIGVDDKGKKSLVIDNIEADTKYSITYRNQLEKEIKTYVDNYAKACNLTVSQGPDNNDLTVAKYEQKYKKIGGYNRISGYYLEAEPGEEGEDEE